MARPLLDPEDVLSGRARVGASTLAALIRQVNPTGLDLPAPEMAKRYRQKSRLQSLLIRRFPDEIAVRVEPEQPNLVLLVHRPSGAEACHALLDTLDEDARSWVQRRLDLGETEAASAPGSAAAPRQDDDAEAPSPASLDVEDAPVGALLSAGQEALEAFHYDRARRYLEGALERSGGGAKAAVALLTLLVDHLASDDDALAVAARLSETAAQRGEVRLLLAVAAARRGARAAALQWMGDLSGGRAAEALSTLARAALAAGDVEGAARDLAEAEARDPAHPTLRSVGDAIRARRAAERAPLEEEVERLLAEGELEAAALRARVILGRWPDSAAARRALDASEAARRRAAAERALTEAEQALAERQTAPALALLRQAKAGLGAEEGRRIQARIAAIEAAERARVEAEEIEGVVALLQAEDPADGLFAYVVLDGRRRDAARARVSQPQLRWLEWLEEMGARGAGARARAAVQAALALGRAEELALEEPEAALTLLAAHERALQGVRRARKLGEEAAQRREARRREEARAALKGALQAEETADSLRARELLASIARRDFPDSARQAAVALEARLARRKERRLRAARVHELRQRGEPLPARRLIDEALAREGCDEEERARWAALRAEVQAEVQAAFRVQVLEPGAGPALLDFNVAVLRGVGALLPDGRTFVVLFTLGVWVTLRLYDIEARALRSCVALRTPLPLRGSGIEIAADRMILIGREGYVLELALDTWEVLRWYSLVPQPGPEGVELPVPAGASPCAEIPSQGDPDPEEPPPRDYVARYNGAFWVPGTSLFWIVGTGSAVTVLDTMTDRPVRELSMEPAAVEVIAGLREPFVAVLQGEGAAIALYTGRGAAFMPERRLPALAMAHGLAPAPGREGILVMAHALWGAADRTCELGWLELSLDARAPVGAFCPLPGAEGAEVYATATDAAAGLTFALLELPDGGRELVALGRSGGSGALELRWRARVPTRTILVQHGADGRVTLLASRDDGLDAAPLGATPPELAAEAEGAPARIPDECARAFYLGCVMPGGALARVLAAWIVKLRGVTREGIPAIVEQVKERLDPDQLTGLCLAWMSRDSLHHGVALACWGGQRYPDHAGLCMLQGVALVNARRWAAARALLARVDTRGLDPELAKHAHHLRATASLHVGEREEAREVLEAAERLDGDCALDWLIALATPLEEEAVREWTPVQAAVRAFARAVAEADARLAEGDAAGAVRALDRRVVWENWEIQSLARLAEAHLSVPGDGPLGRLRKAMALAALAAVHAERRFPLRRELPVPSGKWPAPRLEALRERAEAWLAEALGGGAARD